ncbi:MAG: iron donor protein CyaY [Thioalkalispiraceae bacterium]|jgi:CyaY protein
MEEPEFNQRVDDVIDMIEERLDETEADLDYEMSGGVLTIAFANNSKIIINRQTPLKQIWVATKAGGFHFDYNSEADAWVSDSDGTELFSALTRYCSEQAGEPVNLSGY